MSSSHIIVVARNPETGELELPLGDLTLYGAGGEEEVLETASLSYRPEWTLSLYRPYGDQISGDKK